MIWRGEIVLLGACLTKVSVFRISNGRLLTCVKLSSAAREGKVSRNS